MKIRLLTIGKMKKGGAYLQTGIDEFLKRLRPYAKVEVVELQDETITPSRSRDQVLEAEGARILAHLEKGGYAVVLSERGERLTSEQFAAQLARRSADMGNPLNGGIAAQGSDPIIFIVGGALGVSQKVIDRADWLLSLSPMTFPHQMVRLFLLEQLYRAFKIQSNEPYHK